MTRRKKIFVGVAVLLGVAVASGGWHLLAGRDGQALGGGGGMTARAAQVMPFDLNRTTHTFTKTPGGGVEKVLVKDPADARNQSLIRSHLSEEAMLFRRGDYADPAMIHGMGMPGLKELEAGATQVSVVFADVVGGAQITYSSTDSALASALHAWFDGQVADHSMPGMGG
jgi:hypothetical protein